MKDISLVVNGACGLLRCVKESFHPVRGDIQETNVYNPALHRRTALLIEAKSSTSLGLGIFLRRVKVKERNLIGKQRTERVT